ncbi:MAG: ornithine carbamoyltransferase [Alphaproteobacteria bacterium]|nr:ornithine carbamoyltransferase [Alphaproteobacteria bacterium]
MTDLRHFIDISKLRAETLALIFKESAELKRRLKAGEVYHPLANKHVAMLFEKSSTRTRVSFEVGIHQLGAQASILTRENSQIGRGESPADTARTLSRYVDAIMIRCYAHDMILEMAEYGSVPVINGLSDFSHPCQVMTDIFTYEEHRGSIKGKTVAWIGDGNNMSVSWVHAAVKLGFTLKLSCPENFGPYKHVLDWANDQSKGAVIECKTPQEAVEGADLVNTDTWISMHDQDTPLRNRIFRPYQVNEVLMALAKKDALFMHCLPAKRGEEVTEAVLDGPQSVIWDEAENRLHVQKAIMLWCMKVI